VDRTGKKARGDKGLKHESVPVGRENEGRLSGTTTIAGRLNQGVSLDRVGELRDRSFAVFPRRGGSACGRAHRRGVWVADLQEAPCEPKHEPRFKRIGLSDALAREVPETEGHGVGDGIDLS